ncbi:MAG: trimeric intracellular cation channel family protein [Rhizobiales bacterium]|nr:trimeric intracellular cation channel family protein [Hyphomicrobiales bacterium]
MFDSILQYLDWFGICIFALSGTLVASRKRMDVVGFAFLGCVTGIGGGTVRDVLLGSLPVFWVKQPAYVITCLLVSCTAFFLVHHVRSRLRLLLWCDAVGLALFSVTGAATGVASGAGPTIAIVMGVATATFGGVIRDMLGGEIPIILRREIYVTAALLGAATFATFLALGASRDAALVAGFLAAFALRAAAIVLGLSLPVFSGTGATNDE